MIHALRKDAERKKMKTVGSGQIAEPCWPPGATVKAVRSGLSGEVATQGPGDVQAGLLPRAMSGSTVLR